MLLLPLCMREHFVLITLDPMGPFVHMRILLGLIREEHHLRYRSVTCIGPINRLVLSSSVGLSLTTAPVDCCQIESFLIGSKSILYFSFILVQWDVITSISNCLNTQFLFVQPADTLILIILKQLIARQEGVNVYLYQ